MTHPENHEERLPLGKRMVFREKLDQFKAKILISNLSNFVLVAYLQ